MATDNEDIVCGCNNEAILLTVKKDGPNKGRKFYKCRLRSEEGGCNFFLWAPEDADGTMDSSRNSNTSNFQNFSNGHQNSNFSNEFQNQNDSVIQCNCNLPANMKTVQKEGPNKGRNFYACPKPIGQGCGFFKWTEDVNENDNGGGSGSNYSYNRWSGNNRGGSKNTASRGGHKDKRSAPYKNPNQTRARRKCGNCGQEGHIRTKCPNI